MLSVTDSDHQGFSGRANAVDRSVVDGLYYLGNYVRDIPSNLTRMMENAHDWEHLPFVHPSSFAAIALVEQGKWGWRCKTALPGAGGEQLIELLVDNPGHYWATTVVDGPGQGTQIHTQACARETGGITVDVRFYAPQPPVSPEQGAMILAYLQAQYKTLYDEDEGLMLGRQTALDERKRRRAASREGSRTVDLGPEAEIDRAIVHPVQIAGEDALVRFSQAGWAAHAARCPHALGPLEDAMPDGKGRITCPWHGYRFDLATGTEQHARCAKLAIYDCSLENGRLLVSSAVS